MSYDDFCRCTPEEFDAVCKSYHSEREAQLRDGWEKARWQASVLLLPHVKDKVQPKKHLPLPWDEESSRETPEVRNGEQGAGNTLSKAAQLRRMKEVAARVGAEKETGKNEK